MPKYGVTGSTGHLGSLVITALLDAGVAPGDVVAIARTPTRATALVEAGVDVRHGDYSKPDTMLPALAGVQHLLLVSASEVGHRVAEHTTVVEAAVAAGVQHLVYTSVLHADSNPLPVAAEHRATERVITDSGLAFTFLRNCFYTENYTENVLTHFSGGAMVGASRGARVSAAPRVDYAAACAAVLTRAGHRGATYELGGSAFTMDDLAAAMSRSSGTEVEYHDLEPDALRVALAVGGMDAATASFLLRVEEGIAGGHMYTDSDDLPRLIGRESTPLAEVLAAAAVEVPG